MESKVSLSKHIMILYLKIPKNFTKRLIELINSHSKEAEHKN